jgi:hypothetical protein
MTLTDGAIMFIGCALSFTLGYIIGAVRVTRHVNKRLEVILQIMTKTEKAIAPVPQRNEPPFGTIEDVSLRGVPNASFRQQPPRSPQAIEDEV